MKENNKTFDQAKENALLDSELLEEGNTQTEVEEVIGNKKEVNKEVEKQDESTSETVKTEIKSEIAEMSPDELLNALNKLGFKVKGKEKTVASTEELKRLINLGFNYSENARKLNEEKRKLKEESQKKPEEEENPFLDETQVEMEKRLKRIEEHFESVESREAGKEVDMAIESLKLDFPDITEDELDAVNFELQNRLELIPSGKEIDLKSLMHSIYLELDPDALNKKVQLEIKKKVQEQIDEYKKTLSKKTVTEGGNGSGNSKSIPKSPRTFEEARKLMEENSNF